MSSGGEKTPKKPNRSSKSSATSKVDHIPPRNLRDLVRRIQLEAKSGGHELDERQLFEILAAGQPKPDLSDKTYQHWQDSLSATIDMAYKPTGKSKWFKMLVDVKLSQVLNYANNSNPPIDSSKLWAAILHARAEIDRAILTQLSRESYLQPFCVVDEHNLTWLIEREYGSVNQDFDRQKEDQIKAWLDAVVENRFSLFLMTYRVWLALRSSGLNPLLTFRVSRELAFVAITYGLYVEAVQIADYALEFADSVEKMSQSVLSLSKARLCLLRATAHGRLGENQLSDKYFADALHFIDEGDKSVETPGSFGRSQEAIQALMAAYRERIRTFCRPVMSDPQLWRSVEHRESTDRIATVFELIEKLIDLVNGFDGYSLPIDHDTIARGTLLFCPRNDRYLNEVRLRISKARSALNNPQMVNTINASKLTNDCLDSTEIVYLLVTARWQEAYELFQLYDLRIKFQDRRSSRACCMNLKAKIEEKIKDKSIQVGSVDSVK